jgi:hypothetical protein
VRGPSVVAALSEALLCQHDDGLRAFDPASGRVVGRVPSPFVAATHADTVAWCGDEGRHVTVTDFMTGGTTIVDGGPGARFACTGEGAFSPDGTLLALSGGDHPAVVDVRRKAVRLLDDVHTADHQKFAWRGDRLVFTTRSGRLGVYDSRTYDVRMTAGRLPAPALGLA